MGHGAANMCSAPPELNGDPEDAISHKAEAGDSFGQMNSHVMPVNNGGPAMLSLAGTSASGPAKMDVINPAFVFSHFHQQEDLHARARNVSSDYNIITLVVYFSYILCVSYTKLLTIRLFDIHSFIIITL